MAQRMKQPDQSGYVGPVNSWKSLGFAVVRQAIIDYYETELAMNHIETARPGIREEHEEVESFLRSTWVEFYTGMDGPTVLRKIKDGEI